MTEKQKPTNVLVDLYAEGVRMWVKKETGKLLAMREGKEELDHTQRRRIKQYIASFKKLVEWDPERADKLASNMLKAAFGEYRPDGKEMDELEAALAEASHTFNEAYQQRDMGLLRYACTMFVRRARSVKSRWQQKAEKREEA